MALVKAVDRFEPEHGIEFLGYATPPSRRRPGRRDLGDVIGHDDPGHARVIDHEVLKRLVGNLSERDKRILLLRCFRGMTQVEIGTTLGVSQMHVSRLIARIRCGFGPQ